MKCPSLERLAAYQADFLSRRDREALRAHISACAACQQELALLERAAAAVAALPAPRPPDELWQRGFPVQQAKAFRLPGHGQ